MPGKRVIGLTKVRCKYLEWENHKYFADCLISFNAHIWIEESSSNNIYLILLRILVWLEARKYKRRIFHRVISISKIRGTVLSLPNPALGGLPSTVLAAPPATPDPAVLPPPASGRQLLPLEKWLQSLRWGTVPEHGQCRSSGVFCIALLSPPAGTRVRVSLLTDTSVPHGSQHK